jgi:hypothetical protein
MGSAMEKSDFWSWRFCKPAIHYKRKSIENIDAQTRLVYWEYHSFDGDPFRSKRPGESHDLKGNKRVPRQNDFFQLLLYED